MLLLTSSLPFATAQARPAEERPALGLEMAVAHRLMQEGIQPELGSFWATRSVQTIGWQNLDTALATGRTTGAIPVIFWYYWGDTISPDCVENGCQQRSKAEWFDLTSQLAQRLQAGMPEQGVIVVLENEFNKGGMSATTYAPTFDGYLEQIALELKSVDGVRIALGFGGWMEHQWERFPRAIAASDMLGFQLMRAQTRDTETYYRGAAERIAWTAAHVQNMGKESFLYDLALSSYPDERWLRVQAETIGEIMSRLPEYRSLGLQGIVYRELVDNPNMGTTNYYKEAEMHWGLRPARDQEKPAWPLWRAAWSQAAAPNLPGSFEAESMLATSGGRQTSSSASGGAFWNVWSNGVLLQEVTPATADVYRVTLLARGSSAEGVDPRMELRVNGIAVAAWFVESGTVWNPYAVDVHLPVGTTTLTVAYTNDRWTATEDRNLHFDVMHVERAPGERAPTAAFTWTSEGHQLTLDASASSGFNARPLTYSWNLGDGQTASGGRLTHTYAATGIYRVSLTVSDGKMNDTLAHDIAIPKPNRAPTPVIAVTGSGETFTFDARGSSDPDGDAITFGWRFPDGKTSQGPVVTRTLATGTHVVRLDVTDAHGMSASTNATVTVDPFAATFRPHGGNEWWVQTAVDANKNVTSVCARVDGGACQPLTLREWGSWAASFRVRDGAHMTFVATTALGERVTSTAYHWPNGAPAMQATFQPHGGNEWWMQTRVSADQPITNVCASVDGGPCQALRLRDWGSWAGSFHAPNGSSVVFRATGQDGQTTVSQAYKWPVK